MENVNFNPFASEPKPEEVEIFECEWTMEMMSGVDLSNVLLSFDEYIQAKHFKLKERVTAMLHSNVSLYGAAIKRFYRKLIVRKIPGFIPFPVGEPALESNSSSTDSIDSKINFKKLPFFDVIDVLLRPLSLIEKTGANKRYEQSFSFNLTFEQMKCIKSNRSIYYSPTESKIEYGVQVQLRFCQFLPYCCDQNDEFPDALKVKINKETYDLPKTGSAPLNITPYLCLLPKADNKIDLVYHAYPRSTYYCGVFLVRKMKTDMLIQRITDKGVLPTTITKAIIMQKLTESENIQITGLTISLLCPVGRSRISLPCRATTCDHIQCFDAYMYLGMNEIRAKWKCPICGKAAKYENIMIDGYFQEVLRSTELQSDVKEIMLSEDGSWKAIHQEKPGPMLIHSSVFKRQTNYVQPSAKRSKI